MNLSFCHIDQLNYIVTITCQNKNNLSKHTYVFTDTIALLLRELYVTNKKEEALSADQKERSELLRRQHELDDVITEDRATIRVQVSC